jgi:glycosyltransferase involved in cell wall biosynthesis
MRIGIDIRSLQNDSQNRGIGMYTRCLVKNLLSIDRENEYIFFVFRNKTIPEILKEEPFSRARIKRVDYARKNFFWCAEQILLPIVALRERLDIYHSPEYMVPVLAKCKKVITVHDFIYREYKEYVKRISSFKRLKQKILFYLRDNKTLKFADTIIADSIHTKEKVMELIGAEEERIKVIYLAADEAFRPKNDEELFSVLKKKYNIYNEFLLYVGAIDCHKNIEGLIRAFAGVKFKETDIVLAGAENDVQYLKSIIKLIKELRLKNRVHILGYVSQEDIVGLYNMAKVVISVSFYEGFGLPIVEAMACGRPVIASGNTSMAETVDSSGMLVDPYNTEEITQAIDKLLSDEELRRVLSEKGLRRSREFSWKRTAEETLSLYKYLAG